MTPSKERFEKNTGVRIPHDFEVIEDTYKDAWSNYLVNYKIRFTPSGLSQYVANINTIGLKTDTNGNGWFRDSKGYGFRNEIGEKGHRSTSYSVELDTISGMATYTEGN